MSLFLAIDPGSEKCGLLLADVNSKKVIEGAIVNINNFIELVSLWKKKYLIEKIIIGNGTNSNYLADKLKQKEIYNLLFVNEKGSTFRARFRYWELWPPNYFFRWLPKELLFPPDNLDAIVALILLEDFVNDKFCWPETVNLKVLL